MSVRDGGDAPSEKHALWGSVIKARSVAAFVVCSALLGGCGEDSAVGPFADAGTDAEPLPVFNCWPDIAPIERGAVTLGAGGQAYSDMPDTLPLEWGAQDGFMVKVWMRMTGFIPGGPPVTSSTNPFTRVRAKFADTNVSLMFPGDCGGRLWYVPNSVGGYDQPNEYPVMFNTCWRTDRLIGARIQIDLELMDATGSYASDSRVITITEPVGEYPPDSPTAPSCGT